MKFYLITMFSPASVEAKDPFGADLLELFKSLGPVLKNQCADWMRAVRHEGIETEDHFCLIDDIVKRETIAGKLDFAFQGLMELMALLIVDDDFKTLAAFVAVCPVESFKSKLLAELEQQNQQGKHGDKPRRLVEMIENCK